ncbi:MAG: hypothetical protein DM484_20195, partial [Candidatus Methylumidiphilus alinenensis]
MVNVLTPERTGVPSVVTAAVGADATAFAETAEIPPIANAAAATSATRLKAVFVDIIFLSEKVDWE